MLSKPPGVAQRAAHGGAPFARHCRVPCHLATLGHPRQRELQRVLLRRVLAEGGRIGHFC